MTGYAATRPIQPEHGRRVLNISAVCVDRHLGEGADRAVVLRHGAGTQPDGQVSCRELHERVCRLANALRDQGVQHGDRVAIHLPLMVESLVAVLACIRIGAVYVVLAGGLDAQGVAARLGDCGAVAVLTGDGTRHDTSHVPLKATLDKALDMMGARSRVRLVLVATISGAEVPMKAGRDHRYDAVVDWYEPDCPPEAMYEDDPLFVFHPLHRHGAGTAATCTVGEYRRLTSYAMEMLYPHDDADVSLGLIIQAWNRGQTSPLLGLLARGGTLTIAEGGPVHGRA